MAELRERQAINRDREVLLCYYSRHDRSKANPSKIMRMLTTKAKQAQGLAALGVGDAPVPDWREHMYAQIVAKRPEVGDPREVYAAVQAKRRGQPPPSPRAEVEAAPAPAPAPEQGSSSEASPEEQRAEHRWFELKEKRRQREADANASASAAEAAATAAEQQERALLAQPAGTAGERQLTVQPADSTPPRRQERPVPSQDIALGGAGRGPRAFSTPEHEQAATTATTVATPTVEVSAVDTTASSSGSGLRCAASQAALRSVSI